MTENIRVTCLVDRYLDTAQKTISGTSRNGTLIEVSAQTMDDNSGRLIPVGIVLLDEINTFVSVPIEFISKEFI